MAAIQLNTGAAHDESWAATEHGFDPRELRRVLGSFTTGVTVITTVDEGGQAWGLTANSFSSVSLDPPLVLWSQAVTAPSHAVFRTARNFAINILAEDQITLSERFSRAGKDKFLGVRTCEGLGSVPLIEGCAAHLECSQAGIYPGGDHAIFLGRVERFRRSSLRGLVFGRGHYLRSQPHELDGAAPDLPLASSTQLRAVRMATHAIADLSRSLGEPAAIALSVWGSYGPTVVHWETPRHSFPAHLRMGAVCRLSTSATGLAFAAFARIPHVADLIAVELAEDATLLHEGPHATISDVKAALAEFRNRGLARVASSMNFESTYGGPVSAVCAPVFDADGDMVVGLTAAAPVASLDVDWDARVPRALRGVAEEVSQRLAEHPGRH